MRSERSTSKKSTSFATAFTFAAVALLVFAIPTTSHAQAAQANNSADQGSLNQNPDASGNTMTGQDMVDKAFLRRTLREGVLEVKLGEMALERTSNDSVKKIAAMVVRDRGHINNAFSNIAKNINLDVDLTPSTHQLALMDRLDKLSGAEFDAAYIKVVLDYQKNMDEAFEREASYSNNSNIKVIATHASPILHTHRQRIEAWAQAVTVAEK